MITKAAVLLFSNLINLLPGTLTPTVSLLGLRSALSFFDLSDMTVTGPGRKSLRNSLRISKI